MGLKQNIQTLSQRNQPTLLDTHKLYEAGAFLFLFFLNVNADYQHRVTEIKDILGNDRQHLLLFKSYPKTKFVDKLTDEFIRTYKKITPVIPTSWVLAIPLHKLHVCCCHRVGVMSAYLYLSFTFKHFAHYMTHGL